MAKEKELIRKEGFTFSFNPEACTACQGRCCNGASDDIFVTGKEIKGISRFLGIETSRFIKEYLIKLPYKFSIKEIETGENYACIFFDKKMNKCFIYPVRPYQCRTFPFWSYFKDKPEEAERECPGISITPQSR